MKALNLTYSTMIIVNQSESKSRTVGQGRTEEQVSGDKESTVLNMGVYGVH